ncbi:hypothetical protein [Achromobacter denitrificans]|uniref:hypothetical protein n=1 Tax=Achromobacter denitrificans TaxID=32002 RepID=UPI00243130D7|nr:hypothetical protein [Achromobacter denitrificans]MBV2160251.1 hypothetical protein [Achromobacter denitrificans]
MAITSLPAPPSRSDPENFAERADAFMAALPQFAEQANVLQAEVNQTAESVDNDAIAAAASSAYAQDRAESAEASAEAATAAQQTATQKAADAGASASLAEQWATKTDGPVDGGKFSAAHYAALAAAGMGLPVRFLNDLPATDIGPIAVPTQGQMEWVSGRSRYEVLQGDHGQCEFVYVSSVECRLMPRDGDGLIINGKQYRILAGGVPLFPAALAGGISTWNYIYAYDNAGNIAIEGALTAHELNANGIRTKIGDPSRTLIGVAYKNSLGQFQYDNQNRGVSSWFNRAYPSAGNQTDGGSTASATRVALTGGFGVWVWRGEDVRVRVWGAARQSIAGGVVGAFVMVDETQIDGAGFHVAQPDYSVGYAFDVTTQQANVAVSEGFHYSAFYGSTGGSGTATFNGRASIQAYRG